MYQGSKTYTAVNSSDIDDAIPEVLQTIHTKFQEFEREESGLYLEEVIEVELYTAVYEPLAGSSYIELPIVL